MNVANRITITRIVLVPVFVASLLYYSAERPFFYTAALLIFLVACVSDALDGYLARRRSETTELGAYLDPIADKLLLLSGFLSLSIMPGLPGAMHMPAWVTISVLSRDILIVIGSMLIFFTRGFFRPKPIYIGKVTTVVQMAALFGALIQAPGPVRLILNSLTLIFTLWSGVLYVNMGGRMLQETP